MDIETSSKILWGHPIARDVDDKCKMIIVLCTIIVATSDQGDNLVLTKFPDRGFRISHISSHI